MGQHSGKHHREAPNSIPNEAAKRAGRISVSSRYHRLPRRIEDDYHVTDKVLGSGYNGVVRMATSKRAKVPQAFAVKAFKLSSISSDKRAQLDSEVAVFLEMDHPHVARLHDVYETTEQLHLIMECLEGGELFDRVTERKRFSELDAAETTRQMLLAVNYLHSCGIVHRDLKLENFLYDYKEKDHIKLIDFGFSKVWDPCIKMHVSCGTLSYVAPEVLNKSYTSQCDLWSLGVIAFILLAGYMPFSGSEGMQKTNILAGRYTMKSERWNPISRSGVEFVKALLQVDPELRLTAEQALEHPWVQTQHTRDLQQAMSDIDMNIIDSLRQFGQASKFRRCCMNLMAWSLSNEERAKVREYFVAMDKDKKGTITLLEFEQVMMKVHISDAETRQIFEAMDSNNDETIHYSDFLAAMLSSQIAMHDDLLRSAFNRFDLERTGYITVDDVREVLGDSFKGEQVETLMREADLLQDDRISYAEFVAYLRGTPLESHGEAGDKLIDRELRTRWRAKDSDSRHNLWSGLPTLLQTGLSSTALSSLRSLGDAVDRRRSPDRKSSDMRCCQVQ